MNSADRSGRLDHQDLVDAKIDVRRVFYECGTGENDDEHGAQSGRLSRPIPLAVMQAVQAERAAGSDQPNRRVGFP